MPSMSRPIYKLLGNVTRTGELWEYSNQAGRGERREEEMDNYHCLGCDYPPRSSLSFFSSYFSSLSVLWEYSNQTGRGGSCGRIEEEVDNYPRLRCDYPHG